ncbi:biotin carboxylase N-terminal domain-containing protein [Pseudohaliea sp.]|uniref:acetyl/propionyl/methylcrotonyl-CoA carboxylase subunit alpha n=1 Tax=Pseudohaliea sp. TaxID=2740289 RepID=UPI0032EE8612
MNVPAPLRRILIANRGEVAIRIAEACRRRGIDTVVVYSDADAGSPHRLAGDQAFRLAGSKASETYLAIDRLLAVALASGADAVHPGYGFLAESTAFARAVGEAGLRFIGPDPGTIETMADKQAARALVASIGLPVIPGENPVEQGDDYLRRAADRVGFPLLVKAVAGGGGMGMRVVVDPAAFPDALSAVRREAEAAFGDPRVLLERFVENVHHVEVQVLGDRYGTVAHAFDRECSVQRRRQKVIEEAPSPNLSSEQRARLCDAAVQIASAVGYCGLGTVEFIVQPGTGTHYFLEMNTRLQVEHAVTEKVTGLDLVDWQLRLAEGAALGALLDDLELQGHAIEARLYAEDPAEGFLPAAGCLARWVPVAARGGEVMSSVTEGMEISSRYDPMLAKFVAAADTRAEACRLLRWSLARSVVLGVATNRELLLSVLRDGDFQAARTTTAYLEARPALACRPGEAEWVAALPALALWQWLRESERRRSLGMKDACYGYRRPGALRDLVLRVLHRGDRSARVEMDGVGLDVSLLEGSGDGPLLIDIEGQARRWHFAEAGGEYHFFAEGDAVLVARGAAGGAGAMAGTEPGAYLAPMPGRVIAVPASEGRSVALGDCLCVLESMKMEHAVCAAEASRVSRVAVAVGDSVSKGQLLVRMESAGQ